MLRTPVEREFLSVEELEEIIFESVKSQEDSESPAAPLPGEAECLELRGSNTFIDNAFHWIASWFQSDSGRKRRQKFEDCDRAFLIPDYNDRVTKWAEELEIL